MDVGEVGDDVELDVEESVDVDDVDKTEEKDKIYDAEEVGEEMEEPDASVEEGVEVVKIL